MRGFLYRAFRGSYGILLSVLSSFCIVTYFHWGLLSNPLVFVCLTAGAILLCTIREWTGSLWNCILFHAVYNASVTLDWPWYVLGMFILLPFCVRTSVRSGRTSLSMSLNHEADNANS